MSDPRERSRPTTFPIALCLACLLLAGIAHASPSITLSRKSGPPTSKILVSGRGFAPNVGVDIYFDTKDEALVVTNGKGEFDDAKIHAPRSSRPGKHWVTALERNNDKGAQEPFLVQTNWSQFHFTAGGTRVNPYENVLDPKNVGNLALKWRYKTGGEIHSSPAVVDGVVYVGSNDYNVYALNARTGRKLWSYSTFGDAWFCSPAVVEGIVYICSGEGNYLWALNARTGRAIWYYDIYGPYTPAVVNGVVYIGSDDGTVYALNARTGAKVWSVPTYYNIQSAPTVVDGVVYINNFVRLYALDASTGNELWDFDTGGYAYASPAVADGILYFDIQSGDVVALNASNGNLLWSFEDSSWAAYSPAVSNGVVYVATDTGAYALNGSTGAELWSYSSIGGVSQSAPAVANGVIYFGTADDKLYALSARTGERLWSYATGGYIEGSATVANGMLYVGSDDGYIYAFGLHGGDKATPEGASKRPDLKTLRPDFNLNASQRQ